MRLCSGMNGTGHWCKYNEGHDGDCLCNCGVTEKFLKERGF